ncbi:hypothetical protein ACTMS0_04640 [Micromonospora sp. H33]|uniref:hypothetical protein n=1 Tax=Micromonospora sp. H33 TaxID=3452215 RepID=UPI003F88AC59
MTRTKQKVSTILASFALSAAAVLGISSPAFAGQNAFARVYVDGKFVAEGKFNHDGDYFSLTKRGSYGNRPYLEYVYIRKDGTTQTGTHWGLGDVGNTVYFDHNFGEGRAVAFRVCVQVDYEWDPCSHEEDEVWAIGYA